MPKRDPSKDPSTKSAAYQAMEGKWRKVSTVLEGTEAMREAGQNYLPRHERESGENYSERLRSNVLFNSSKITLEGWTTRPFQNLVQASVPDALSEVMKDVDSQGNSATVFARRWFREGLAKAFAHVLVEFPPGPDAPQTLADDRAANKKPYWCFVPPENLIFAASEMENGREILTHVRMVETEVVRVGFAEMSVERIRVYDRVRVEGGTQVQVTLWRKVDKRTSKDQDWVMDGPPRFLEGMDEIPLVTFYADRTGLMQGVPPLEELVDLNIRWWQSNSDQISVLTVARFPILAGSGISEEDSEKEIGPKKFLWTPDSQGRYYYVEHAGRAIEAGRLDLLDLEDRMSAYGAQFLRKKPGDQTATERALDSAESTSQLKDAVVRFNDSLSEVLRLTGKWVKIDEPGTVKVPTDFGPGSTEAFDLQALQEARRMGEISRERFLAELKRRGLLADDFDGEADAVVLAAEVKKGLVANPSRNPPSKQPKDGRDEDGESEAG